MSAKQQNETSTVVVSLIAIVAIVLVVNFLPSAHERIAAHIHEFSIGTPSAEDLVKKEVDRLKTACSKGSKKECDYLDAVNRW